MKPALGDQIDRDQIATALDDTLIVEAAAGTGKTTELVRRIVRVNDAQVRLSPKQYRLLQILVTNAGKVVTHRQLLQEIWGAAHRDDVQYLRVFIRKLRRRLEADPARPRYLLTELGVGYRLRTPDQLASPP